jgi:hypothetical protein
MHNGNVHHHSAKRPGLRLFIVTASSTYLTALVVSLYFEFRSPHMLRGE